MMSQSEDVYLGFTNECEFEFKWFDNSLLSVELQPQKWEALIKLSLLNFGDFLIVYKYTMRWQR